MSKTMFRNDQLSTEFSAVVKGKNFMTPHVVGFWASGDYVIELSKGNSFGGGRIYGVTVVNRETKERELELDQSFNSLAQAKAYMRSI